jgi:CubicO group peptidase (beta-lactamase class C family)
MSINQREIDSLFSEYDRTDSPGCALAVLRGEELVYSRGFGMADLENSIHITTHTIFDIASAGKQFTAMLVLMLAEEGLLRLDAPIREYIPQLHFCCDPINIRHLLYHTSGLRDYCDLMELSDFPMQNFHPEAKLLDLICMQKELVFTPGDEFLYSNTGYFLLGLLIQRITGRAFLEIMRDRILTPLEMNHTFFNDDFSRIVSHRAKAYIYIEESGFRTEISMCGGFGDGPILTSVVDLCVWDRNFCNNQLAGGGNLIREMETPGRLSSGKVLDYGCGLMLSSHNGLRTIGHSGSWAGYRSQLLRFPDQQFSVILLANISNLNPTLLAYKVADLYLDSRNQKISEPARTIQSNHWREHSEELLGFYQCTRTGEWIELISDKTSIFARISGETIQLKWENPDLLSSNMEGESVKIGFLNNEAAECQVSLEIENQPAEYYVKLTAAVALADEDLIEFCGIYRSSEIPATYYIFNDRGLCMQIGYAKPIPLRPITRDYFSCGRLDIHFERDDLEEIQYFWLGLGRIRPIHFKKAA